MNTKQTAPAKASASESEWQKTPYSNLIRYVPSGTYFARIKVKGKLIRRSLKTKTLSVGKLRLADLEKEERKKTATATALLQGKMTFGEPQALLEELTERVGKAAIEKLKAKISSPANITLAA